MQNAINEANSMTYPTLHGDIPFLSLGGGNDNGAFNLARTVAIGNEVCSLVDPQQFKGIMFDVELVYGPASEMIPAFAQAFAAVKACGFLVGITVCHSAPYHTDSPQVRARTPGCFGWRRVPLLRPASHGAR